MSSTFTPSDVIDESKEKEWAANIGMLDWDSTSIVFTKRSLIEFLKYTGITVDTNFNSISKLPRYAKFGTLAGIASSNNAAESNEPQVISASSDSVVPKPSRRVRTAPGGATHDIFGHDEGDDALSRAPPKLGGPVAQVQLTGSLPQASSTKVNESSVLQVADEGTDTTFKSSRRARTNPGGQSSLVNFWDVEECAEDFKPTRRVREGPGGRDHINDIF